MAIGADGGIAQSAHDAESEQYRGGGGAKFVFSELQQVEVHREEHAGHRAEQRADKAGDDAGQVRDQLHRQGQRRRRFIAIGHPPRVEPIRNDDHAERAREGAGIERAEKIQTEHRAGERRRCDAPQRFPVDVFAI